jgi:hypothetical protein
MYQKRPTMRTRHTPFPVPPTNHGSLASVFDAIRDLLYIKRDLVYIKRDPLYIKRDLLCIKRDLVYIKRELL